MQNKLLTIDEAIDTPFFHALLNDVKTVQDLILKRKGYAIGGGNFHLLTINEKKTLRTFELFSSLTQTVESIATVHVLLNRFPPKSYLDKHDLSEIQYIQFHYEVFLHKVHTICELMKLISNEVMDINLSEKDCSWDRLIKNKHFKNSTSYHIINRFYLEFKKIIEHRHLNTHQGLFFDKKMDEVASPYNVYRWSDKYGIELDEEYRHMFPRLYVKYQLREYRKGILNEIKQFEQKILLYILEFFKTLNWVG